MPPTCAPSPAGVAPSTSSSPTTTSCPRTWPRRSSPRPRSPRKKKTSRLPAVALAPGPIPLEQLSDAVKKVAGPQAPAALKLMAARGLAPMGPTDLATAVFQLSQDSDEKVDQAADKTGQTLPDKVIAGALPAALDARVLDFFARKVLLKPHLVEIVVLNQATDDDTFVYLASNCSERELE